MAISKKLTIVFTFFYVAVIIYLLLFLTIPEFQDAIIQSREQIANLTQGPNYFITLLISLFICLLDILDHYFEYILVIIGIIRFKNHT